MIRAYRNSPLTEEDRELKRFLSGIRAHVEHLYAAIRRAFHFTRMLIIMIGRMRVKAMLMCACFNLMWAVYLTRLDVSISYVQLFGDENEDETKNSGMWWKKGVRGVCIILIANANPS